MRTIALITKSSIITAESVSVVVNVSTRQMRGIVFLKKISSIEFDYSYFNEPPVVAESAETLYSKFFVHVFQNRLLTISRLKGNFK